MTTNTTYISNSNMNYAGHKNDRAKITSRWISAVTGLRNPEMYLSGLSRRTGRSVESVASLIRFMVAQRMIGATIEGRKVTFY